MLTAIVAILIFALLVTVHEFGHFLSAKLSGMYVEEFSIGMGPQICSRRWGETRYSLRLLPVGGYVRVLGEDVEEEAHSGADAVEVPEERRYQNRPVWQRMIFASAGSFMNVLTAILIFAGMYLVLGLAVPIENPDTTLSAVMEGGPAEAAGLAAGDRIVAINGQSVSTWEDLTLLVGDASQEEPLAVTAERDGSRFTVQVTPVASEDGGKSILGIYAATATRQAVGPIRSLVLGAQTTWEMTVTMVDVLGDLFTGKIDLFDDEQGLTGPVGIVRIIDESTKAGWIYVFNLAAVLSLNLAVINLLPIPSLDGSKLIFLLIEGVRGRPIDPQKEGYANLIGFSLLMLLIVLVTYKDIVRLFSP